MSIVDSILNVMHMNPDDDDDYYDDYYDDEEDDDEIKDRKPVRRNTKKEAEEYSYKPTSTSNQPIDINRNRDRAAKTTAKVTPMRPTKKTPATGMEVCIVKPTSFEDAREITETLLMNRSVILNVEGLDVDIAQRIIDFSSGSCFAISGNLQKISNYIFIITPANVEISGDFQNLIDAYGAPMLRTEF